MGTSSFTFRQRSVDNIKLPRSGRMEYRDELCPGLELRVSFTGVKVYYALIFANGRQKRVKIGDARGMRLADARRMVWELKAAADERSVLPTIAEPAYPILFSALTGSYVRSLEMRGMSSWSYVRGNLNNPHLVDFGSRRAATITKPEIVAALDEIGADTGLHSAKNVLRHLRPMFKWGVGRGDVPVNPCDGIPSPTADNIRDRTLSNPEMRAIYIATRQLSGSLGHKVRMLFHTAARLGEVADMKRSEIIGDTWVIPGARTKNGRDHHVPLTSAALADLRSLPDNGPDAFIFSTTAGKRPSSDYTKLKAKLQDLSGTKGWNFHDIRRTVRTKLAELGVPEEVAERVLNHTPEKLVRTYNRHRYRGEIRDALEKWGRHLAEIVGEQNQATAPVEVRRVTMRIEDAWVEAA